MKFNKGLNILAILLLLTITLAACGDNTATTAPAAAPTTGAAMTTAAMTTAAMMTTPAAMTTAAMTTPAATTSATTMAPMTTASTTMAPMTSMPAMTTAAMTTTSAGSGQAASGKMMEITISNFSFMPDTLTVPVGTKVVWTNKDSVGHTVTSDDTGGPLKSPLIDQGKTFEFTFDKAGTYSYHCTPHPFMKGTVIVR